jgi:hypothetical protein
MGNILFVLQHDVIITTTRSSGVNRSRETRKNIRKNLNLLELSTLINWGINCKLRVSICNNAASNSIYLQSLYITLNASVIQADIEARRMQYFGHILNLIA